MDAAVTFRLVDKPDDLDGLAASLRGMLTRPGDEDYEAMSGVWNTALQQRPAAIARVADAADVGVAIAYACRNELEIAVRSGGHSLAGHSTGDGVLVIDTRGLRGLHIDLAQGIVWAGAGLTAGDVHRGAQRARDGRSVRRHGSVGLGGITLGGGIGYLARKYGLTVDSLLAAEIVTADGEVRMASATEHPDLFWAIRGGGGNFGIATRFCYRLSPVGQQVLAGAIFMPGTRDVLRSLVPIATSAPEELTVIAELMAAPPLPFLPAEHVGKPTLVLPVRLCRRSRTRARPPSRPFREVATPYAEVVQHDALRGDLRVLARGRDTRPAQHPSRSVFLDVLDDESVDAILDAFGVSPEGTMVQMRAFGGAMSRVPADATAFAHRSATAQVTIINGFVDPARRPRPRPTGTGPCSRRSNRRRPACTSTSSRTKARLGSARRTRTPRTGGWRP